MSKIRVVVADDHSVVRMGIVALFETVPDVEVVGEAEDGESAVREAVRSEPDLVLMDLMMPGSDGVAATGEIKSRCPGCRVLVLTTFGSADVISRALAAGADGVLLKSAANDDLIDAVRKVASGQRVIASDVQRLLEENPPLPEFSPRQQEILESMARGLTNRDMAVQMGISPEVVKDHLNAIFAKLGAANRTEAVAIALRRQLLKY